MPISWNVNPVGDTLRLRRHDTDAGVIAVLFRDLPPEAKAALEYLAGQATRLYQEKVELLAAYDAEVHAHNETRRMMAAKANVVLQKGIELLVHSQKLQDQLAELRELRDTFPFV